MLKRLIFFAFCLSVFWFSNSKRDISAEQYISDDGIERTLYHYVYREELAPNSHGVNLHKRRNLMFFVNGAVKPSDTDTEFFIFTISNLHGERFSEKSSQRPLSTIPEQKNVRLLFSQASSDICAHAQALLGFEDISSYKYFVFINDGVRGPFTNSSEPWIETFLKPLRPRHVALVGSTISCQHKVHVQSYFMLTKFPHIKTLLSQYRKCCKLKKWDEIIQKCEIGVSQLFLNRGFSIASTSQQIIFRKGDKFFEGKKPCKNPTAEDLDIFETMMVKYGGNVYKEHLIPRTVARSIEAWTIAENARSGLRSISKPEPEPMFKQKNKHSKLSVWRSSGLGLNNLLYDIALALICGCGCDKESGAKSYVMVTNLKADLQDSTTLLISEFVNLTKLNQNLHNCALLEYDDELIRPCVNSSTQLCIIESTGEMSEEACHLSWQIETVQSYKNTLVKLLHDATWEGQRYTFASSGVVRAGPVYKIRSGELFHHQFYALHANYIEIDKLIISCGMPAYKSWVDGEWENADIFKFLASPLVSAVVACKTRLTLHAASEHYTNKNLPIILLTSISKGGTYGSTKMYLDHLVHGLVDAGYAVWIGRETPRNLGALADFSVGRRSAFFLSTTEGSTFDESVYISREGQNIARIPSTQCGEIEEDPTAALCPIAS